MSERPGLVDLMEQPSDPHLLTLAASECRSQLVDQVFG
jgi:hypothetical protein